MKIVSIGEILIDLTQKGFDENGVPVYAANPGGAPANVAVAASLMGADSAFIGKAGNDALGKMLKDTLTSKNVDVSGLKIEDKLNTTLALVSVDEKGDRSFSFYRDKTADVSLTKEDVPQELIRNADILHFGSVSLTDEPSASATAFAVESASKLGKVISYDPNFRPLLWKDKDVAISKMKSLLKFVDIIKVSEEELELLSGKSDLNDGADELIKRGISFVIVTLGENGAFYKTQNYSGSQKAFAGKVADTNGAGDTFFGTFLSQTEDFGELLKNKDKAGEYIKFACAAAGLSVTRSGAIPAMPTYWRTPSRLRSWRDGSFPSSSSTTPRSARKGRPWRFPGCWRRIVVILTDAATMGNAGLKQLYNFSRTAELSLTKRRKMSRIS